MTTREKRLARRRLLMWTIPLTAVTLAAVLAVTYAWFSGRAANVDNQIRSGSMNLELLTTSPTRTIDSADAPTELSPAGLWRFKEDSTLEEIGLLSFFKLENDSMTKIVSIGDNPQSLVKFLEYDDPARNDPAGTVVSGALPGFRQQRPILVYNPNDQEATYTLDFVARTVDGQTDLRPAFYFNCTPLGMRVSREEGQKPIYSEDDALLTMDVPASILEGTGAERPAGHRDGFSFMTGYETLTPLLARPDAANGRSITPVDAARLTAWASTAPSAAKKAALSAAVDGADARTIRIQPHCYHVYLVDMGLYPTAGNSYQGAGLALDIVLTAQQRGDTVHRVYDENELARAITDNAIKAKANGTAGGDTIVLMKDVEVTGPLPAYRAVFNLVLDGHVLTFGQKVNAAGETTEFGSLLVGFPEVAATMEIGSPSGGRIVNADRMHFEPGAGAAPCVLTWYGDLCFREVSDGSASLAALAGPAAALADSAADAERHPRLSATAPQVFGLGNQDAVNADAMSLPAAITHIVDSTRIQVELRRLGD